MLRLATSTLMLFLEQLLNGVQLGMMLFLMAAGLTLIFGIMHLINLAHGSLYMVGAYVTATVTVVSESFLIGLLGGCLAAACCGILIELLAMRHLYHRDHLDQVLATFGIILTANEATKMIFGPQALFLNPPSWLSETVNILPDTPYPAYRLFVIISGIAIALLLRHLITHTRLGMLIRAGATHREMVMALGFNISRLFTVVFALGAGLAGLAGGLAGPLLAIEVGMGEQILILTFVVIIIGGIGSVKGALVAGLLVGIVDTLSRAFLPALLKTTLPAASADALAGSVSSMAIYIVMALVLIVRPEGLYKAYGT